MHSTIISAPRSCESLVCVSVLWPSHRRFTEQVHPANDVVRRHSETEFCVRHIVQQLDHQHRDGVSTVLRLRHHTSLPERKTFRQLEDESKSLVCNQITKRSVSNATLEKYSRINRVSVKGRQRSTAHLQIQPSSQRNVRVRSATSSSGDNSSLSNEPIKSTAVATEYKATAFDDVLLALFRVKLRQVLVLLR